MNDKKNIWLINETAVSPEYGMVYRQYYLAKYLVKLGYHVTIISATYSHLFKKLPSNDFVQNEEVIDGIQYVWLRVPHYKVSKDKKRVLKWFIFAYRLFRLKQSKLTKPDDIVFSCTTPFSFVPAMYWAKRFKAKLFFEVRDIWPLSIIELGGFSPKHPLIAMMSWFEKFAMKKADVVVSNLPNYGEHLKNRGVERPFEWISNGIDLEELQEIKPLPSSIVDIIPKNKFIVGYTGTIGTANAMESFCEAAKILETNQNIALVIVGEGQEKDTLKAQYGHLSNLIFIDAIPKNQVQSMLAQFDVCYFGWNKLAIYQFGTSANKTFDYMYSGKPILNAFSGGGCITTIANCGINVEAMNAQAIANGVLSLFHLPEMERLKMGENGKEYVLKHFTYENLAKKYAKLF